MTLPNKQLVRVTEGRSSCFSTLRGDASTSGILAVGPLRVLAGSFVGEHPLEGYASELPTWVLVKAADPNVANALTSNYFAVAPFDMTRNVLDGKINWNPTSKLSISGRVGFLHFSGIDTEIFANSGALQ